MSYNYFAANVVIVFIGEFIIYYTLSTCVFISFSNIYYVVSFKYLYLQRVSNEAAHKTNNMKALLFTLTTLIGLALLVLTAVNKMPFEFFGATLIIAGSLFLLSQESKASL